LFDSFFWSSSDDDDENENDDVIGAANPILEKQLFLLLLQKRLLCVQSKLLEKEEENDIEDAPTARISSFLRERERERERERVGRTVTTRKLAKRNKKETEKGVFRVLKIRKFFFTPFRILLLVPPTYEFSHKNHRPKGWWWWCCGVRLSPLERRDKEKNAKKKSEGFGRVQKRKYSTTAKKHDQEK
jgi:hypothetical protein